MVTEEADKIWRDSAVAEFLGDELDLPFFERGGPLRESGASWATIIGPAGTAGLTARAGSTGLATGRNVVLSASRGTGRAASAGLKGVDHAAGVADAIHRRATQKARELLASMRRSAGTVSVQAPEATLPLVTRNKIAGDAFRDEIAGLLKSSGRQVELEVYKRTPLGKRYIDIDVWLSGRSLGGIETKFGGSRYIPTQRAKDAWLRIVKDYPVNVVRPGQ